MLDLELQLARAAAADAGTALIYADWLEDQGRLAEADSIRYLAGCPCRPEDRGDGYGDGDGDGDGYGNGYGNGDGDGDGNGNGNGNGYGDGNGYGSGYGGG